MNDIDIEVLVENDEFLIELSSNIWLMDNHKWAFYVWEKFRFISGTSNFSLVHADYHWDGGNDFHSSPQKREELLEANLDGLYELVKEGRWIRFDSFISPGVIRGFISEIHFYCKQDDGHDIGVDEGLLREMGVSQILHTDTQSLKTHEFQTPIIFDLCLDLFNRSTNWYAGDLWPDKEIIAFLHSIEHIIRKAELVTVSLSFGYSGTEADTKYLAGLVLPILKEWRS